jgi:hypothetical protein
VQKCTIEPVALFEVTIRRGMPVAAISHHRVTEARKVTPDLVLASLFGKYREQAVAPRHA